MSKARTGATSGADAQGQTATVQLCRNLEDQLSRLVSQLADLEEARAQTLISSEEFEESRNDTLEQLREFEQSLARFRRGLFLFLFLECFL